MAKKTELVRRIQSLQGTMNQVDFAERLNVPQSRISDWYAGRRHTAEMYLRLAKIAPYPENLWFLERVGLDKKTILGLGQQISDERIAPPAEVEGARVESVELVYEADPSFPRARAVGKIRPVGKQVFLPPFAIRSLSSTVCLTVEDSSVSPWVGQGTIVALDTANDSSGTLEPFWDKLVLAEIDASEQSLFIEEAAPTGLGWPMALYIGRLRCKRFSRSIPGVHYHHYLASLDGFCDFSTEHVAQGLPAWVGHWFHPLTHERGTPEEIETTKSEARVMALREMRTSHSNRILGIITGLFPPRSKRDLGI